MLSVLELKDFAIVDELRLELSPGLNALTGETGAGKSLLVDALALLTGQRASSSMIRSGCAWALVQAQFEGESLESAARRVQSQGRATARVDGELVTVAELAQRVGEVVAVHGQHAAQSLTDREEPRRRLDTLLPEAGQDLLRRYGEAFREYRRIETELQGLRNNARERERRRDTLRFEIDEIDAAQLQPGDELKLRELSESLRHAERIVQSSSRALEAVAGEESSALLLLATASRELENAARHHPALAPLAKELDEARASVQATGEELESFLAGFEVDPRRLDEVESRLARLESLARKYGDGAEAILTYRKGAADELERLEGAHENEGALEGRLSELEGELARLGRGLGEARRQAAEGLGSEVTRLLATLGMPGARFDVELAHLDKPGPTGLERVRFLFAANPGEPAADLAAVASGGELSRVMLALDVITGSDRPVLVFDEVDAGVGGKAARAVGGLLKRLSSNHQVLVVTHLPQVAAFADAQYFVEKRGKAGRTVTAVHRLQPHEREQELARMLSGSVTEASLSNARELVREAQGA